MYVDWDAFKLWGSVSLVAVVLIIGLIIWCCCCSCCCDSCCCSGRDCDYDCHCSCCSRVKKENVTKATNNEGLELGEPVTGVYHLGVAVIGGKNGQVRLHDSTKGKTSECSFSYEDETNDRRVSVAVVPRRDHNQERECPDDVTSGQHNDQIPKVINYERDNKGYEDDGDDLYRPGYRPDRICSDDRVGGPQCSFAYGAETNDRNKPAVPVAQKWDHGQDKNYLDDENTKDSEENHRSTKGVGLVDKLDSYKQLNYILRHLDIPDSDEFNDFIHRYNIDDYNSEGESIESSSSSEEEEVRGFRVGDKLMARHVVRTREMPADMSTKEKEDFAYQKARRLYNCSIPWKYTLILIDNMNDFRRKILNEAVQKAVGLYHFTTTERFDVVHFNRTSSTEYTFSRAGQARLKLSCNPEQVVSHLAGVVFPRFL